MPRDVVERDEWTTPINVPLDQEAQSGASIAGGTATADAPLLPRTGVQALANRTVHLNGRLGQAEATIEDLLRRLQALEIQVAWPIGTIITSAIPGTSPSGPWLWCNGDAVSRATYVDLFNVIGTQFGGGDGLTTFNVPAIAGRALVGSGGGAGLTNRTLGQLFGEETNAPSLVYHGHNAGDYGHGHYAGDNGHGHGLSDPQHTHRLGDASGDFPIVVRDSAQWSLSTGGGGEIIDKIGEARPAYTGVTVQTGYAQIGVQNGNAQVYVEAAGDSAREQNLQPSIVMNFYIRYALR